MECKKCQSKSLIMRPNAKNPSATELICANCGAWQKFIGKEEIRLFEIRHQKQVPAPTNADRIRGAQDKEIARELLAMYLHGHCDCNEENGFCVTEQGLIDWLQQPAETEGTE